MAFALSIYSGEDPGKQKEVLAATCNGRWCSPDSGADFYDAENLLSALHSLINGTAKTEVAQSILLL